MVKLRKIEEKIPKKPNLCSGDQREFCLSTRTFSIYRSRRVTTPCVESVSSEKLRLKIMTIWALKNPRLLSENYKKMPPIPFKKLTKRGGPQKFSFLFPLNANRTNRCAHVYMVHGHDWRTVCSVCATGARVAQSFPSNS